MAHRNSWSSLFVDFCPYVENIVSVPLCLSHLQWSPLLPSTPTTVNLSKIVADCRSPRVGGEMFDLITKCGILGPQEKLRWKLSEMVEEEPTH
jgi:hypothetical protein